ncbi:ABC transporter E family member 2-like protein [Tanacetum coccineum]
MGLGKNPDSNALEFSAAEDGDADRNMPTDIYLIDEPSAYLDSQQRIVASKVIKRFILHAQKTAFVVERDFIMATYLADRVIVYEGQPCIDCIANDPQSLLTGMNLFLSATRRAENYMFVLESGTTCAHGGGNNLNESEEDIFSDGKPSSPESKLARDVYLRKEGPNKGTAKTLIEVVAIEIWAGEANQAGWVTGQTRLRQKHCMKKGLHLRFQQRPHRWSSTYVYVEVDQADLDGCKSLDPTHWHFFNHEQNADFDIVIRELSYFEDPIKSELLIQGMEFQPIEVACFSSFINRQIAVTMANTTTSDPEKAIVAATSNLKGEAAQQRIMHAAQYSAA